MTRIVCVVAALALSGCAGLTGNRPVEPVAGPTSTPSPTGARGDIEFLLEDTYGFGDRVEVKIVNNGDVAYRYNSTGYEACELTYRDEAGREFIIPPGTHCDLVVMESIRPGETVTLFEWELDECVKDNWGCVEAEPLKPGTYSIEGTFPAVGGGPPAHAEVTFEIVPVE